MNRAFFVNLVFLLAINGLVKPVYLFGIDRTVQNTLPEGEYGLFFALFNFTYLFQIINDFGLQVFNNRQVSQNRHMLGHYLPNLLMLKAMLALLYLTVVGLVAWLVGYEASLGPLLALVALNQILVSLLLYLRSNISGLGFYRLDSAFSALDKLLLIGLLGFLLWHPAAPAPFQLWWFVAAQTAALTSTTLLAGAFVLRRAGPFYWQWRPKRIRLLLRRSLPYALAIFLMTLYTRLDGVMIERLLPDGRREADLYASAFRLLDAANALGVLFAGLLLPMLAYQLKLGKDIRPLIRLSLRLIMAIALTVAITCLIYSTPIMEALYVNGSAYSGRILALLMLTFVAMSGNYIYSTLLTANGQMGPMNRIFLGTVLGNLLLNALLIPAFKAQGAAFATLVTQGAAFGLQLALAMRLFGLRTRPTLIGRLSGFSLVLGGAAYGLKVLLPLSWWWAFGLSFALGGLLALAFGLVQGRRLLALRATPQADD